MQNIIFKDNMRKVSKIMLVFVLIFFALAAGFLIDYFVSDDVSLVPMIIKVSVFFIIACICTFYCIYAFMYTVIVTETEMIVQTISKKIVIVLNDILCFKFLEYFKTGYYQFKIVCKSELGKSHKISISNKHMAEFVNLLKNAGVEEENG